MIVVGGVIPPAGLRFFSKPWCRGGVRPRHIYPDAAKEMLTQLNQALR